jgi:uncharacterized protein
MGVPELVVPVTELLRHPAMRRDVRATVPAEEVVVGDVRVEDGSPIVVDLELESLSDGLVLTGRVDAGWTGPCRRCLGPAHGTVGVTVRELYQARPSSEDAFVITGDLLDLWPAVREGLMLELPLAPVCRPDCAGLCPVCGVDRNEVACTCDQPVRDQRWAALDALRDVGADDMP